MPATQSKPSSGFRRALRRAAKLLIVLVILGVVVVIAVRVVLASDLPRRIVVDALQESTGLEVQAASLRTGWSGRAELRDVVLRLPLDSNPLATVPVIRVRHTPILALVLFGVELRDIEIEKPTVYIYEDARGRWSLPRALDSILSLQSSAPGDPSPPKLPRVAVIEGVAEISRPGRPAVRLPLSIQGDNDGALTWALDAEFGDARIKGRIDRAGWAQELDITLADLSPLLGLWSDEPPATLAFSAHWSGAPTSNGIDGLLTISNLEVADAKIHGDLAISVGEQGATIRPGTISVASARLPGGSLLLSRGSITADPHVLSARGVRIEAQGHIADLTGRWDMEAQTATLSGNWSGTLAELDLKHDGHAEITADLREIGRRTIRASVQSNGAAAAKRWWTSLDIKVDGPSWESLEGVVTAPTFVVSDGKERGDLSGLAVSFNTAWPRATVTSVNVPGVHVTSAEATMDLMTKAWSVSLDADRIDLKQFQAGLLAVSLRSTGDTQKAEFSRLHITGPGLVINATGTLVPSRPEPLIAHADLNLQLPALAAAEPEGGNGPGPAGTPSEREPAVPPHGGTIAGDLEVIGTTSPMSLRARGRLTADDVRVAPGVGGVLDPIQAQVRATAEGGSVTVDSDSFSFLGGQWTLRAGLAAESSLAEIRLDCKDVPLDSAVRLAAPSVAVTGALSAGIDIRIPDLDLGQTSAVGAWSVGPASAADLTIDHGEGKISFRNGRLLLSELVLARAGATVTGSVGLDAADPQSIRVDLNTQAWPLAIKDQDLSFLIDSSINLDLDIARRSAAGRVSMSADAALGAAPLGRAHLDAVVNGRTIEAKTIHAAILGGTIDGRATIPLDRWTSSILDLQIQEVDLSGLAGVWAQAAPLKGVVSGTIGVAPSKDPRAIEPLGFAANFKVLGGAVNAMSLGDSRFAGFAGPDRIMLDRSEIDLAGGTLGLWGRMSVHDNEPFVHLSMETQGLDLDQLIRAAGPTEKPTSGRITGRAAFGGYTGVPHRAYGQAELAISDADLGNIPVISQLYGLLNLGAGSGKPSGQGLAQLRLDGDTLVVERMHYFNRGIDIIASAAASNIWQGASTPISGVAAGVARPLKDSKLPLGSDLDRVLGAVFADAVSVSIGGTLQDREIKVVPFANVQGTFGRLLGTSTKP